jgi:hypothetical protein
VRIDVIDYIVRVGTTSILSLVKCEKEECQKKLLVGAAHIYMTFSFAQQIRGSSLSGVGENPDIRRILSTKVT